MESKEEVHELIPSARRLISSLRDIGYDFSTAIADLVDNSIEAGASRIDIQVQFDGGSSYVRVSDNGKGMDASTLKEAMRYGSERSYGEDDLGKFGLGLKTASMSQCRRFSVASRISKNNKNIVSFSWDLGHIEETNKWEILKPDEKKLIDILHEPLKEHTGTVVLLERLDRILDKYANGEQARKKLISMCRELEEHLAMVFHKFLAKETPRKVLEIFLNGNKVEPWDPFARQEPKTKSLTEIRIPLQQGNIKGEIILRPYILPPKDEFSSVDTFNRLAGPGGWNQQQGFYIYRANRMIQSGGWCKLRARDEHTKLSRIELSFSTEFDDSFKINVAKMRVQLPLQIREEIDKAIVPTVRSARDRYDRKEELVSPKYSGSRLLSPVSSLKNLLTGHKPIIPSQIGIKSSESKKFTLEEIEYRLCDIANGKEKQIIQDIFKRLRKKMVGEVK